MSSNVHEKFLSLIKRGALGTIDQATCTFKTTEFISTDHSDFPNLLEKVSDDFYDLVMKGSHPTLNPFLDDLSKYECKTLKNAIREFVKEKNKVEVDKCDVDNDVITFRFEATILTINALPFFDQEKFLIEKAEVQTALFKYDIENETDE